MERRRAAGAPGGFATDVLCWIVAVVLTGLGQGVSARAMAVFVLAAAGLQGVTGAANGLYRQRWRAGSYEEVGLLAMTVAIVMAATSVGMVVARLGSAVDPVPFGSEITATAVAFVGMGAVRYRRRWRCEVRGERRRRFDPPSLQDPIDGDGRCSPSESDLLGRSEVDTDVGAVARHLADQRVLVTGAGGSIGSELCRQLWRLGVRQLVMLDRDESGLHAVQLSVQGSALLDSHDVVVCDIRDAEAVAEVFAHHRPDVVFHAAALKHLPLLEMYPGEAVKTNVLGTRNVLAAAAAVGVRRFVNISTDKAADPVSVLGYTKRIGERITARFARDRDGTYLSVRFGNVLGSRGSVLTSFKAQAESGGPLTVTHPDVTRYFMTVEEAVQLVLQAGIIGAPGEVLVLDMGTPVRIADVARRLAVGPSPVEVVYTGLRPGEKLHEVLFGEGEQDHRPLHPLISHTPAPPLPLDAIDGLHGDPEQLRAALRELATVIDVTDAAEPHERGAGPGPTGAEQPAPGPPILLSPPHVGDVERRMLLDAFDSNWLAPVGPHLDRFEAELSERVGVDHAVALSSGTAALHLALEVLGVGPGDTVLVPSATFVATANVARYVGATPVFIDADADTWNLSPALVAEELDRRARTNTLPRAVIAVDIYGQCADHDALAEACARYGIPIVEDAAESLGSTYKGRPAGSFGTMGVFSFNGNKIITTSGGGMLVSSDGALCDRARHLAAQAREPVPHYEHHLVGYNYRMSNLLAALGRGQLHNLDDRVAARRRVNRYYRHALRSVPGIELMPHAAYGEPNWWLTCILVDPEQLGIGAEELRLRLAQRGIEARRTWKPMHLQPLYRDHQVRGGRVAEDLFDRGLCLPSGSALRTDDLERVVTALIESISGSGVRRVETHHGRPAARAVAPLRSGADAAV
jgi:FlaA1/EpsC-like NDP-sugar epimerase/dTDP-4-amino-4,6-dideoxygalactose transaminase